MNNIENVQNRMLDQVAEEQSLRKQISEGVLQVLKNPATDLSLRMLIIVFLADIASGSLYIITLIIYLIAGNLPPFSHSLWIILGFAVSLIIVVIPMTFKANSAEQALRLNDSFNKVYAARIGS